MSIEDNLKAEVQGWISQHKWPVLFGLAVVVAVLVLMVIGK